MSNLPPSYKKPPKRVSHARLVRAGVDSAYKSQCPDCKKGILFVSRDQESLALTNVDFCGACGQTFIYTDKFINGEPVADVAGKVS